MEATGCKLSSEDLRDYEIRAGAVELPSSFILEKPQKIKNQKSVSSCVAHATSSILEYHDNGKHNLSTNFIYGFADMAEMGMCLRDACDIVYNYGDMLEKDCPGNYEIPKAHQKFLDSENEEKYTKAYKYRISSYYYCRTNNDIKYAIMNYGPVLGAVRWYDNYSIGTDGSLIMDLNSSFSYHAIVIYGWDETGFICQNSWGSSWGNGGSFHINYDQDLVDEARALIDYANAEEEEEDEALVKPINNVILNVIYKFLNFLLNAIKQSQLDNNKNI